MYRRPTKGFFIALAVLWAGAVISALWGFLSGELPPRSVVIALSIPLLWLLLWVGKLIIAVIGIAVVHLFYSPLFLTSYIVGWIQKICGRKKP